MDKRGPNLDWQVQGTPAGARDLKSESWGWAQFGQPEQGENPVASNQHMATTWGGKTLGELVKMKEGQCSFRRVGQEVMVQEEVGEAGRGFVYGV